MDRTLSAARSPIAAQDVDCSCGAWELISIECDGIQVKEITRYNDVILRIEVPLQSIMNTMRIEVFKRILDLASRPDAGAAASPLLSEAAKRAMAAMAAMAGFLLFAR